MPMIKSLSLLGCCFLLPNDPSKPHAEMDHRMGHIMVTLARPGVIGLTKAMASDYGSRNINVNAIASGWVAADMTVKLGAQDNTIR